MSGSGRGLYYRWRRITALAVACAFLLMSGFAALHLHSHEGVPAGVALCPHEPAAGPAGSGAPDLPGGCLACLWSRAAVSGPLAGTPHVSRPAAVRVHPKVAEVLHCRLTPSGHLSRGPPSPSA